MKQIQTGDIGDGIFFDGYTFFITCEECGHEQGDMGRNVTCEECGEGTMRSMETDSRFAYDDETETYYIPE